MDALVLVCVLAGTLGAVWGGPRLGDHEALVAQCARETRTGGHWLVSHYLGDPYVRKPPLPYWLIAGLSYVFPNDPQTGLPVTTTVARLPSALAALGTVLLMWRLASVMFGHRVGRVTAVMGGSSLFILLYAPNATVEMLLTFCCVWAHTHFWFALGHPVGTRARKVHLFFFYVAMGAGMMAKGPFPLVMVAFPIAVWWYTERPLRMLARGGLGVWRPALWRFVRGLWPRTVRAFRELWLVPGVVVFLLCFVPWMVAVGMRHPDSWHLWNWQYLQRAKGDYEDTRPRGPFYFVPVVAGLILPWLFLVFEGMVAPWIRKYARQRRSLLYVGLWGLFGVVIMSLIEFKKPYYIVPALPALILLMSPVADRFYARPLARPKVMRALWIALVVGGVGLLIGGHIWLRREMAEVAVGLTAGAGVAMAGFIVAAGLYVYGRRWAGFGLTAATFLLTFHGVWYTYGGRIDNDVKVARLVRVLEENGVPRDARIYWVDRRPDARLRFYYDWLSKQMIDPSEVVVQYVDRTDREEELRMMVMNRAEELLSEPEPVYLVLGLKEYGLARMVGMAKDAVKLGEAEDPDQPKNNWVVVANEAAARRGE